jgi:hypothetical protein
VSSLLEAVCALLRRTYALEAPLFPIGRYVIGDDGFRRLYTSEATTASSEGGEGGRLLLRETDAGLRACIYFPDAMIRHLEAHPPQRRLDDANVDAFAVLVEETDHLLVAAERCHEAREVSLLELELQANVSKDLVLSRFLARQGRRLGAGRRTWLRHHLFHKRDFRDSEAGAKERYDDASRFALHFLGRLEREAAAEDRLRLLRRFHRAPLASKLEIAD